MNALRWLVRFFCGCRHERQSGVRLDNAGQYRRCLDCGERLSYTRIHFPATYYSDRFLGNWRRAPWTR
jgi:hypothetical protein